MVKVTHYEWDVEEYDEHDDIVDHDHGKLATVDFTKVDGVRYQLVLVRDVVDEVDGLVDRSWAYAKRDHDGRWVLPVEFDGGAKVPRRYHEALAAVQENQQARAERLESSDVFSHADHLDKKS